MKRASLSLSVLARGAALAVLALVGACGVEVPSTPSRAAGSAETPVATAPGGAATPAASGEPAPDAPAGPPRDIPANPTEASRFLAKATFGATPVEIDRLMAKGYSGWIDEQTTKTSLTHVQDWAKRVAALPEGQTIMTARWPYHSTWRAALSAEDVLRQRVAYALSQIFVVSLVNTDVGARMSMGYLDMLGRNAFGNFRQLLEDVSLSPAMGVYLSARGNRKEDLAAGRIPDENYAREIMQLFTIGLHELEQDGTVKLDARNEPIETYDMADIAGLARVFTGFSWAGPDTSSARFVNTSDIRDMNQDLLPMQGYPQFHETGPKTFLGRTITASTPEASLKAALDILFAHPNVGPFIGKQLIQKLVTSNPSPAYVSRVSASFADNGKGVRGDMRAVVKAVLLDPEAMGAKADGPGAEGRMREPLMRMTAMLRALGAKSVTDEWQVVITDNPANQVGMTFMRAPSVFGYYRPGYSPPNSSLATAKLVAPEMQIYSETAAIGFLNTMKAAIDADGFGLPPPGGTVPDIRIDWAPLVALAREPATLVDRLILLMAPGQVPADLRQKIVAAVNGVAIPAGADATAPVALALKNRARLAVLLLVASPEFAVLR